MDTPRDEMQHPIFLTALLGVTLLPYSELKRGQLTTLYRMEALGNCPEMPDLVNGFTSTEIVPQGKTLFGKGVFVFRRNYTRFTGAVANIKKCADRNDPYCQTFQNWRFGDETCSLLTMKNMLWTPLFHFVPALGCPVKAGTYRLENITVDISRLKVINFPDSGFWKVSIAVDADKIPNILCYYFEATFIRVRA